ncbi:MAG: ABC transporter permease [Spirochaetaceae bacterium]|nr:ABC transporter permease [Spirochaetaceae bacterium]
MSKLNWILFVARRFAQVDRSGRSAVTTFLASLSICFGVMTLIVVVSVMNGFQQGLIDSIMEISSAHIRVTPESSFDVAKFQEFCANPENEIIVAEPFYEAQALMVGLNGRQSPALIRSVSPDIFKRDAGFAKELRMISGSFDLKNQNSIVLGSELARVLGVRLGDTVNLLALSGGSDVDLLSDNRLFTVSGIFTCGYSDINASYSFISLQAGEKLFGQNAPMFYNLKIKDVNGDSRVIFRLQQQVPELSAESWRSYNRSFFGALRIEKNLLMMLVLLIFVVVGVNIFNGMRRMVFERREEIAILSALGSKKTQVQLIFIIRGLLTGLFGAIPGLMLGLSLSVSMDTVFTIISKLAFYTQYFFVMITNPGMASFVRENPMYQVYARIPARVMPEEVVFITVFGVFSALVASWIASRNIQSLSVSEVLHDE